MPYIKPKDRDELAESIDAVTDELASRKTSYSTAGDTSAIDGEVNFVITSIIDRLYTSDMKYSAFNRAIGVLESVKQEYYRRVVAPYEDKKKRENGDVYGNR